MAKGTHTLCDQGYQDIATHAFQDGSQYNYRPVQGIMEFNVNIMEAARCLPIYVQNHMEKTGHLANGTYSGCGPTIPACYRVAKSYQHRGLL